MAEVKSSGEIEDILSSIRRLVSEDLRRAPRAEIVSRLVVEDKLILTQALRVVPKSKPPVAEAAVAPVGKVGQTVAPSVAVVPPPKAAPDQAPLPRLHLESAAFKARVTPEVVASLTQFVDQQALDWDSETGDPAPDIESLDWSSFTFARRPSQQTWRPQPVPQPATLTPDSWAQPDPDEGAALGEAPMAEDVPDLHEQAIPDFALDSGPNSSRMASPETAPEWADEAEAEVLADLNMAPHTPKAEVMPGPAQEDDNIFSEQVLRELVRDLIREQLQGDLGERITRNIRKLVKTEIARALDVRALD